MAEFTGKKIIRAVWTNEAHDTIMVEFYSGETAPDGSETINVTYIPADTNHSSTKALFAEGYDFERIQKETVINNAEQSIAYRKLIKAEAAFEINKVKAEYQKKYEDLIQNNIIMGQEDILKAVLENNVHEDTIFRIKLAIFDLPEVKVITDKEFKSKIRFAKSLLELFGVLSTIYTVD